MSSTTLKQHLSALDVGFLYAERPGQPMHVGSCLVYEGHISRDELIRASKSGSVSCPAIARRSSSRASG
jgi:hypothetical protein